MRLIGINNHQKLVPSWVAVIMLLLQAGQITFRILLDFGATHFKKWEQSWSSLKRKGIADDSGDKLT